MNATGRLVRSLIDNKDLSEEQANSLVRAAGRRYMRRKLAYNEARQSGKAATGELDALRVNLEAARRVCDVAESVERHARELTVMARADFELESQISTLAPSMLGLVERYNGSSTFTAADLRAMEQAFFKQFGKILPVSTRGDSAVHRALGFDHRGTIRSGREPVATRRPVGAALPHRKKLQLFCLPHGDPRNGHRRPHTHRPR